MPNVNIDVYANTHGAPKDLKDVSGGLEDIDKKGGAAKIGLNGLWKQFALGQFAVDGFNKVVSTGIGFLKDSIGASGQQELAERNLADAFYTTGRNVEDLLPKFKEFANRVQEETIYTDDAVLSAAALMAQLSDLDEEGLQKATTSAIGMASVFKIDLQSAATSVAKAMAGNYDMLARYLPQLKDLKTEEEKHAFVMQEMGKWYQRAKGETDTFVGSLKQLGNMWDEIKEAVGRAVTENETVRELIAKIKAGIIDLIESGKLEEWVESVAESVTALVHILEGLYTAVKTVVDLADKLPSIAKANRKFYEETMSYVDKLAAAGRAKAEAFQDSLKILDIPLERLREEMEKGEKNWTRYTGEMKGLDDAMVANKGTAAEWVQRIKEFLGLKMPEKVAAAKMETIGFTKVIKDEHIPALVQAGLNLQAYLGGLKDAPGYFNAVLPPARDMAEALKQAGGAIADPEYGLPNQVKEATTEAKNHFDGLYNDIAIGFGDVVSSIKLGNEGLEIDFKSLFGTVGEAFKRMIGEMTADWVLGKFKELFSGIASTATSTAENAAKSAVGAATELTKGAAGAISGLWTGVGAAVGSFLGTALAGLIGGGPSGHAQEQAINDTKDMRNFLADINNAMPWVNASLDNLKGSIGWTWGTRVTTGIDKTNMYLSKILNGILELPSYQGGGFVPRDMLAKVHAGEWISREKPAASGGNVNITLSVDSQRGSVNFKRELTDLLIDLVPELSRDGRLKFNMAGISRVR